MSRVRLLSLSVVAVVVAALMASGPASSKERTAPSKGGGGASSDVPMLEKPEPTKLLEGLDEAPTGVGAGDGGAVVIDATAAGDANQLLADLEGLGLTDGTAFGRMVSGRLPISSLPDAGKLESLKFVRPALADTNAGSVDSQGDAAMGTDWLRGIEGIDGTGVTVGTLSDSYDCMLGAAADVASGDLPAGVNVVDDTACPASDEGRGMMQLIHDVAPGVAQSFHTAFNGQADFAQGILDLEAAGADIINDDVFYFAEPFFQDGIISQAADTVVAGGDAYFTSAGNADRQSYESPFNASGGGCTGTLHDFDPGAGVDNRQGITIPAGTTATISFQWSDPFFSVSGAPGAATDLDICLVNAATNVIVAAGLDFNVGGDPVEVIQFANPGPNTNFDIAISRFAGPAPSLIKYVGFRNVNIVEFDTNSGTAVGHSNGVGAESTGAAFYNNTPFFGVNPPIVEPFSSAGGVPTLFDTAGNPINVTRESPDIVAPDGTNTTFFGTDIPDPGNGTDLDTFPNFFGTSAAAPHAAGFAALLLELNPALTPDDIYNTLETTAIDMDAAGFDFNTGYGLINAAATLGIPCVAPPPPPPGAIIVPAPGLVTIGTSGDDIIYGTAGFDQIAGMGGNDVIFGMGGNDELFGADNDDILCGGDGNDRINGGKHQDVLSGDLGNDDLAGTTGQDVLLGGLGDDRLAGGSDSDVCLPGGQPGDQVQQCP